jgi:hypothetical protein
MKVTHFQRECGINANSYGRFMKLKGPYRGADNQTYEAAFIFFKKRELAGVKAPKKKKVASEDKDKFDVSDPSLYLDGEEDGEVEVYDTCDVIRRKINAHLRESGVTKAGFCRAMGKMMPDGKPITPITMDRFLEKKGSLEGNSTKVFYAAYCFFEKLRIKQKKPKTKFREEMEEIWEDRGGFDLELHRGGFIVPAGTSVFHDEYGVFQYC